MIIAIGADHRGAAQKKIIQEQLQVQGIVIEWIDVGCSITEQRCEYPQYARRVAHLIQSKKAQAGILLCGTGIGMSIAANRFQGIYAALAFNVEISKSSKEHDHANVLVIGSDFLPEKDLLPVVVAWLEAKSLEGRHQERILMIDSWGGLTA